MHEDFQRLMQDATRLTRAGNLDAATAAIRSALKLRADSVDPAIIDVDARVVPDADGAAGGDPSPSVRIDDPQAARDADASFIEGRFGAGTAERSFKLFIPPDAGSRPMPLVVMLHGCTQDPDDFASGTGMNEAARRTGFFVLYPAQSRKANPQRCWNWFKHSHQARGRGEPAILAGMTQDVIGRHAIDSTRVYVAGLSAGGAMAAVLGHTYPEIFAAVGVHSGLPAGAARDLPSALKAMKDGARSGGSAAAPAVPTIVIHGEADTTVHPSNAEHLFASSGSAEAEWQAESGSVPGGRSWTRRIRLDANGKRIAEHWLVHGAPHAWSGGSSTGSFTDPHGPDATAAMLDFFRVHAR
ncbi:PHB depolymerase family esterase [Ramlibacter tataouinensis]|uniref:extracellular catalytic domain type 1 short-chain-length polyhydroxyalkanoate depolymerase n=1 Tax=Ramlibacter tataouinensis TaxID=94132 RepID=UPI0022F3B042|nr:PHB depolymerase family esterase [Ramlibacter tataouinensis]WBY02695.1 PHB depolymerase family esterase [Ramlibacter tataouinensis]